MEWSQSRFKEVVAKLKTFLKQAGFKVKDRFLVDLDVHVQSVGVGGVRRL